MKMTREQYLEQQRRESEALLAALMAETEEQISAEVSAEPKSSEIAYIPDGGGDARRTRSGKWLLDLD